MARCLSNNRQGIEKMSKAGRTAEVYSFLWKKTEAQAGYKTWHFNHMQEVVGEPIVRGSRGIDVGSGDGQDTYIMANNNPSVKIASMDISDGVYKTKELVCGLDNVWVMKGSVLDIPVKAGTFDFAYSFGVLHHTVDPERAFSEIARIIKRGGAIFLYLYEDHSENFIKFIAVNIIARLRKITVKINPKILYALAYFASPFASILFSLPSRILMKFKRTEYLAKKMPFNFGTNFFSLRGDLYDRFSAPIEYRFSRSQVYNLFNKFEFYNINITRLKSSAGWVAWGYKG